MRMFNVYMRWMTKYPLRTQILSTGCLMASGDAMSQFVLERSKNKPYDPIRTARFGLIGILFVGPCLRVWFNILERYVKFTRYPRLTPVLRTAVDQTVFAPVFLSAFMIIIRKMEGCDLETSVKRCRADIFDVYTAGLTVWPAAQLINFYFVPLNYRIIFNQSVGLFWNSYLAWRTNRSKSGKIGKENDVQQENDVVREGSSGIEKDKPVLIRKLDQLHT